MWHHDILPIPVHACVINIRVYNNCENGLRLLIYLTVVDTGNFNQARIVQTSHINKWMEVVNKNLGKMDGYVVICLSQYSYSTLPSISLYKMSALLLKIPVSTAVKYKP